MIKLTTIFIFFFNLLHPYQYDLSIFAIFRDESPYLKEWIDFHVKVGVEHFYLYNNLSKDDYEIVLQPYIDQNTIELIDFPFESSCESEWAKIHCSAYSDCVNKCLYKTKWLCCIDIDEFIFSVVEDDLKVFLINYEKFAGLCVNWQLYGSSNILEKPKDKLVTDAFRLKAPQNFERNYYVKSIVKPECIKECNNSHNPILKNDCVCVNSNFDPVYGLNSNDVVIDKIRCNHYWSRDLNYFYSKKIYRFLYQEDDLKKVIEWEKIMNSEYDDVILKFYSKKSLSTN